MDALRQDIDIPRGMMDKWMRARDFEANFRENLQRCNLRLLARNRLLAAIFDGLILNEDDRARLQ